MTGKSDGFEHKKRSFEREGDRLKNLAEREERKQRAKGAREELREGVFEK